MTGRVQKANKMSQAKKNLLLDQIQENIASDEKNVGVVADSSLNMRVLRNHQTSRLVKPKLKSNTESTLVTRRPLNSASGENIGENVAADEKGMSPDRPANGVVVRNREKLFEKWDGILQNFKNQSTPAKGTTGTIKSANKTNVRKRVFRKRRPMTAASSNQSNKQEVKEEQESDAEDVPRPMRKKSIKNKSPILWEDTIDLDSIDLVNQEWYRNLMNMNRKGPPKGENVAPHYFEASETQKIEITHMDHVRYDKITKDVDGGIFPTNDDNARGILRFRPGASLRNRDNVMSTDLHVQVGKFHITYGEDVGMFKATDVLTLTEGIKYSVENLSDNVGVIEFVRRNGLAEV